jgi:hypothetical protein
MRAMGARVAILSIFLGLYAVAAQAQPDCTLSAAPEVPVIRGLPYDQARAALLAAGWVPGHGSNYDGLTGNQQIFHDRGYTELVSCNFESTTLCYFRFNGKGGTELRVTTSGEENPLLDSKATVSKIDLGCGK